MHHYRNPGVCGQLRSHWRELVIAAVNPRVSQKWENELQKHRFRLRAPLW